MIAADALRCREPVALAADYLEQAPPGPERARAELYLAQCPSDRAHLAQLQQTVRRLGQLVVAPVAPSARQALRRRFRAWQRGAV
jgi:anti-sigma factor RsiW